MHLLALVTREIQIFQNIWRRLKIAHHCLILTSFSIPRQLEGQLSFLVEVVNIWNLDEEK